ncbi:MAG: HAD-IA family hydrolase, partial [Eggerthellaceae bacterium]|nr:HAD-IA family hydrolase [Eggerthellaceae bacterium]
LGIISNWDATLEGLVRAMGYLPYFDDVVASAAVGYRKPNPVIFEIALERMGVDANHAFHVGDLPEADGDGATSAGITPIIIDRNGRNPGCKYRTISVMTDLVSLLPS